MSDVSSAAIAHTDQSLSTDSEESFLMKELNRSQLFNNSVSNHSSSSSDSRNRNRRSFFRESYIDDTGVNRSFSIYHDAIDEASEQSIDLAGLSTLNIERVKEAQSGIIQHTVLTTLGSNVSKVSSTDKLPISRSNSYRGYARNNRSQRSINKLSDSQSQSSSIYDSLPNNIGTTELRDNTQFIKLCSTSLAASKTPEIPLPDTPYNDTPYKDTLTPIDDSHFHENTKETKSDHKARSNLIDSYKNREVVTADATALNSTALNAHIPTMQDSLRTPAALDESLNNNNVLSAITEERTPRKMKSIASLASAGKSDSSSKYKGSILQLEQSRKTSKGTPHLLLHYANFSAEGREDSDPKALCDAASTPSNHEHSINLKSQDEIRMSRVDQGLKIVQLRELRTEPFQGSDIVFEKLRKQYNEKNEDEKTQGIRLPSSDSSVSEDSFHDIHYNDQLLEKIHYYREQPYGNRNIGAKSDKAGWILYLISFLVPPLFFFLGLGLLDQCVPDGYISPQIKKTSLYTGIFVCILALGMIALGFAYGIHLAKT